MISFSSEVLDKPLLMVIILRARSLIHGACPLPVEDGYEKEPKSEAGTTPKYEEMQI